MGLECLYQTKAVARRGVRITGTSGEAKQHLECVTLSAAGTTTLRGIPLDVASN